MSMLNKIKNRLFLMHPFLLAVYPVLFLFSHNRGQLSYGAILMPFVFVFLISLAAFLLIRLALKNTIKAAMVASIIIVSTFYYGFFYELVLNWQIGDLIIGRHRYLFPAWIIVSFATTYFLIKTDKNLINFSKIITVSVITLVALPIAGVIQYELTKPQIYADKNGLIPTEQNNEKLSDKKLPDVYYILPDMYVNSSVLSKYFDYDNKDFLDYLKNKGFAIAHQSQSNYPSTYLTLASLFNMRYVDEYENEELWTLSDYEPLYKMIENNSVVDFFKSKGYIFVHSGTKYTGRQADIELSKWTINEFTQLLFDSSIMRIVQKRDSFIQKIIAQGMRDNILDTFKTLKETPSTKGPKFVFFHIPSPHWPYLFDKNGEKVSAKFTDIEKLKQTDETELYLNQLIFVNKNLKEAVDSILSNSDIPPIIIIQSDHGINFLDEPGLSVQNFSAYYLPGKKREILSASMTPVNTFRFIFDQYFGTKHGLLKNTSNYYMGESK